MSSFFVQKQWEEFDGKCGTCGDAYDAEVRENEAGGMYASGVIGRNYTRGQVIQVFISEIVKIAIILKDKNNDNS